MHEINEKREGLGEHHRLCLELQSHEDRFFKHFGMFQISLFHRAFLFIKFFFTNTGTFFTQFCTVF
jgi:hypothetical protein